jgi:hypothetical protein
VSAPSVERLGAGRYRVPCGGTCGGGDGHIVTIAPDVVACDCPAGVFRRPCRHVDAVTRYLVQAPPLASIASGPGIVDVDVPPAECDA